MYRWLRKLFYRYENQDIAPDEIFLDDRNMPEFDEQQFEGRIEQPIKRRTVVLVAPATLLHDS
jgi:hypothetical protein